MPIYEYRCEKCGKVFEALQRFSDDPIKVHEGCGGATERLISQSAFQLKGSGWYVTDYAKGSSTAQASKPESKTETKTETKAETKTESKTESTPAPAAKTD